jgi:type VI secretion system protein
MAIKLRVISEQYRELGDNRSRVFGVNGGTVGRAPDNDWVLPDASRIISGHHFEVEYRGGSYWLKDTSTNGVFVNESEEPASARGKVELQDGDRLRVGDYDILVSVDNRIDFLPAASDEAAAAKHIQGDIGHSLDLDSLLSLRDPDESAAGMHARTVFGMQPAAMDRDAIAGENEEPRRSAAPARPAPSAPAAPQPGQPATPVKAGDWNLRTRPITREELADAIARRQGRVGPKERAAPFHQQASAWTDLRSAVQAFCRGAGIDPESLSPEAQSMLPLVAGQMLREAVVGLQDVAQARTKAAAAAVPAIPPAPGSNPLRTSTSVEQALQRLLESHGRLYGGPVDALRDVLQEIKDHEAATLSATKAGLRAVLERLSPTSIADQFEQGRARSLAPGQDPRSKYWEHYDELYRMLTQQNAQDGVPVPFGEEFGREYARTRTELRQKKQD